MIKHFGSLYAGHIDFGDIGLDATPVNDRRYDNNHRPTVNNCYEIQTSRLIP